MAATRRTADAVAIQALPIGPVLLRFMAARSAWEGTATALLQALTALVPEEVRRGKEWPKQANRCSGQLRRLAPNLRQLGLGVDLSRQGAAGQRLVRLTTHEAVRDRPHRPHRPDRQDDAPFPDNAPSMTSPPDRQPSSGDRQARREHPPAEPEASAGADAPDDTDDGLHPLRDQPELQHGLVNTAGIGDPGVERPDLVRANCCVCGTALTDERQLLCNDCSGEFTTTRTQPTQGDAS